MLTVTRSHPRPHFARRCTRRILVDDGDCSGTHHFELGNGPPSRHIPAGRHRRHLRCVPPACQLSKQYWLTSFVGPVLILPIVASAFGVAHLASKQSNGFNPTALRRAQSPLLILANWLRSALTYAFALFVWVKAPGFGSGPPECDQETRFIFFGASLSALDSGRILNLVGWGILTLLFVWRTYQGKWTLGAAVQGLFLEDVMIKPKEPPKNDINMERYAKYTYHTGEYEYRSAFVPPTAARFLGLTGMLVIGKEYIDQAKYSMRCFRG